MSVAAKVGADAVSRYEFRVFAPGLGWLGSAIRRRASLASYREGGEVYLLLAGRQEINLKIRGQALELKRLVHREADLQQWQPAFRLDLPAMAAELDAVWSDLAVDAACPRAGGRCTAADLVQRFADRDAAHGIARLFKQRWSFRLAGCAVELVEVTANGARLTGAAIESADPAAVQRLRRELGLSDWENVSYVLALSRLLGWVPPHDAG
jgi:hypothetical protein